MKEDRFAATRDFLAYMESRYPGSRRKILERANVPIAHTYLEGLAPGLGQFPGIPPLPTPGGFPTWGSGSTLQPTMLPQPEPEPAWWEKIADAAAGVAKGYLSYKQQDKITDLQMERMKRGLPPIEDPSRYMAPTVKIAHTVDPRSFTLSDNTKQLLMVGGIAAAVLLFMMYQK